MTRNVRTLIGATAAVWAALSLLPTAGAAEPDPLQSTLGSVNALLGEATAQVPQVSAGGGDLPQVTVGGQEGGGLGLSVTPGGSQPGTTGPSQPTTQQPQQGSNPSSGGGTSGGGSQQGGKGSQGGGGAGGGEPATSDGSGTRTTGAGGGSGSSASGSDSGAPPGAGSSATGDGSSNGNRGDGRSSSDKPSLVTRVVDEIPSEYRAALVAFGAIAILLGLLSLYEARRSRRAQENALSDPLTGLANRKAFEEELEREWKRAARYEHDLGLLLIDLDGFKEINDTQGHVVGDRVLREAAAGIAGRVRETDFPARLGGDEFVVICPETGEDGLRTVAEKLERTLRADRIEASVGFSERRLSDENPSALIARADEEMYRRKRESNGSRGRDAAALTAAL